ncbi:MAG: phosphoglycerate kinase [Candidatus Moranbacteria bacterium]|nr:phosphoglycerate kinase [Candidatus Moranbacteria bacterium]
MALRSIETVDCSNQSVLIRVDFNIEQSNIAETEEHFRLQIARKTVDLVASAPGVRIALLTHFGRPDGKPDPLYSVEKLVPTVERALKRKVVFIPDCIGESVSEALNNLSGDQVLLLENVRFYPSEEENDEAFARKLATPFTLYVNEAFSVCHRAHASVEAITRVLPSYAGLRLIEEITELDRIRFSPEHPAIAIIGGAKIETKLPLIGTLEENYDALLIGGKVANEALDQKIVFSEKVLLPLDFDSSARLDIGPQTIAYYTQIIGKAKTIIWNGPMGKFEEKPYDIGTDAVLHAILESKAYVVIGGGESLAVLEKADVINKVSFVSSGGGAMLEYLGGKQLPGIIPLTT